MLLGATLRALLNSRSLDVSVVDALGNQVTNFSGAVPPPSAATLSTVVATTTSQVALPANPNRRRIVIHNDGAGTVFIAFAPTATITAFTYELGGNNTHDGQLGDYTGDISVIRAGGSSNLRITEITTT